jgi:hypothetical protein
MFFGGARMALVSYFQNILYLAQMAHRRDRADGARDENHLASS